MNYVKRKWAAEGPCSICEKVGHLSWDHVPPKGGITLEPVEIREVYARMTGNERKFRISQDGLKYRTICRACNSILGEKYDHVLNNFALSVGQYLQTSLHLPSVIMHRTRPVALLRAVLGHFLATKLMDTSLFDQRVRPFVMDETAPLPDDVHVFYWVYPYQQTTVVRDIARIDIRQPQADMGVISVLKYFPIAYLITSLPDFHGLQELTRYRHLTIQQEAEIPIDLQNIRDIDWPEAVTDHTAILMTSGTEESVYAKPRRKNSR